MRLTVIGLDSNLFIYLLEANQEFGPYARDIFMAIEAGRLKASASELVFMEVLAKSQLNDSQARMALQDLGRLGVAFSPVSRLVLVEAARLRRECGLGALGSIHVASAILDGCEQFVTNDQGLIKRKVTSIRLTPLAEYVLSASH